MMDKRIFTFYVNPYTKELCKIDGMDARTLEALRGQGVTQLGSWFVDDAHNWGVAAMARWEYEGAAKAARIWDTKVKALREKLHLLSKK